MENSTGGVSRKRLTVADLAAQVAELSAALDELEAATRKRPGTEVRRIDASTLDSGVSCCYANGRGEVVVPAGFMMNLTAWARRAEENGTVLPRWFDADGLAAAAMQALLRFDPAALVEDGWI